LEVDLFKKVYELKGLRLPEGTEDGWYGAPAVRWRSRAGRSTSREGGSTTAAGAGGDDRCGGPRWRPRLVGSLERAPRPTATDGCTRFSRVREWRAIPRRCGGCCADEAGWPRDDGRGHGMDDGTRGRSEWPNPIGAGPWILRASGPRMARRGAWRS